MDPNSGAASPDEIQPATSSGLSMRLLLTLLLATSAVFAANMGENVYFSLGTSPVTQTFSSVQEKLYDDEVLKVQLHPMGRKNARPSPETPVWLWISVRDEGHHWVLPWRPAGGHPQQWLEVLLCDNQRSLELMAETNSSTALPLRWSVSTENVKLGSRSAQMKSTPPDVSYRRFSWPNQDALAVELEVSVISGAEVCASLVVARSCVTRPHQLTDSHLLQRVLFARGARLTVSRADAPDGFWLYLIPEVDNTKCAATAWRGLDWLPPPAKTIEIHSQTRAFLTGAMPSPLADGDLPAGDPVLAGAGDWADPPPPPSQCQHQLAQCQQQCPLA